MKLRLKKGEPKLPPRFVAPLDPCNLPLARCPVPRERATQRILIVRVGSHGDILMGTPLPAALRAQMPDAHLTWLVAYDQRESIEANPHVDEILLWDSGFFRDRPKSYRRPLQAALWPARAALFAARLRRHRYDVLISLQPEEWPTLLPVSGARTTVGVFDTFREFTGATVTSPYAARYTHTYTYDGLPMHRTDQYLLPLGALGLRPPDDKAMRLGFTAGDAAAAGEFLAAQGVGPRESVVVVAPMTTWPSRCWDGARYAALADALAGRGRRVVMIGSGRRNEAAAVADVIALMHTRPAQALGALTFRQMAALVARASLVVSGDTGPMHVAAAVGTPYLALFGPTPIAGRAPLAGRGLSLAHPVPCGPCDQEHCPLTGEGHMQCMRLITVPEALAAAERLLAGRDVPGAALPGNQV